MTTLVRVFLVEDQDFIHNLLDDALTEGGFTVIHAHSGDEVMAMLDRESADYSALITDIDLVGKLNGWDVARHAREINDRLPVIYMSGGSAHDWASKGVPNSQLTPKPFAVAQIVTAVAQLINAAAAG